MICKKFLQVSSNDIQSDISFSYDANTKQVLLVSQNEDNKGVLPLGEVKDEDDPNVNITLTAGEGIIVGQDNSININTEFLEGFVANLGYIKQDNDTLYHADETTIVMDSNNTFSVSTSWLNGVINSKGFALISQLPTKVSDLTDDIGILTAHQDLSEYAKLTDIPTIPTNISVFTNDVGYLTEHQSLSAYALKSELPVIPTSLTAFTNDPGYLTQHQSLSAYAKLTDIPTNISVFNNDVGYLTQHQSLSGYATEQWVENKNYLTEHQSLSAYATKAELPVNVSELTNDAGYLTEHQSLSAYAPASSIPVNVSQLVNDEGYLTEHQDLSDYALKSELLTNGTGLTVTSGIISINQEYLTDFVAGLGYVKVENDKDTLYYADSTTILLDGDKTFSVNTTWLDNVIASKGFAQASSVTAIQNQLTGYALKSELPTAISDLQDDTLSAYLKVEDYVDTDTTYTAGEGLKLEGTEFSLTASIPAKVSDVENDTGFITSADIPTSLTAFTNDPGYLTQHQSLTAYAQTSAIPTKVSDLNNDAGFITGYTDTTYTAGNGLALDGTEFSITASISDLTNDSEFATSAQVSSIVEGYGFITGIADNALISDIPTKVSDLTNDTGFITGYTDTTYANGTGITITSANIVEINQEWLQGFVANLGYITQDSDTLYHADEETIVLTVEEGTEQLPARNVFSINTTWLDNYLDGKAYLTSIPSTYAQLSDIPVVPTNVSEFTNDANFATSANVSAIVEGYGFITGIEGNALLSDIKTKTSELENDSNFATSAGVSSIVESYGFITGIEGNALLSDVKTNTNELTNGAGFATSAQVSSIVEGYGFITGIEGNALLSDIKTYTAGDGLALEDGEFSLTATIPVVPTNVSEFANDAGYLTAAPTKVSELVNDKSFVTLADLEAVKAMLLEAMIPTKMEVVTTVTSSVNEPGKNIFVDTEDTLSTNTSFTGNNITVTELANENSYSKFTASGDVTLSNMSSEGTLVKNSTNGNGQVLINTPGRVVITNSDLNQNGYNCAEIGLAAGDPPKAVLIDGVNFGGTLSNNAINIYGTADDAVVTISNCTFAKVSNAVRLSNRTNATNVTVNIVNCEFTEWEGDAFDPTGKTEAQIAAGYGYAGMILCQDYTSTTSAAAIENNLFAPEKIKVNIINCTHNGVKIAANDPADVCGSKNANQILYVYYDKTGLINYNPDKYPAITIS